MWCWWASVLFLTTLRSWITVHEIYVRSTETVKKPEDAASIERQVVPVDKEKTPGWQHQVLQCKTEPLQALAKIQRQKQKDMNLAWDDQLNWLPGGC